jgi:hypothetical protein
MLKDDIKKFFNGDMDNLYGRLYETYSNDKFLDFPKFKSDDIVCCGYPNSEYLRENMIKFKKLVYDWKHHISSYEETKNRIRNFLGGCHADDTCGSEFLIYKRILTSHKVNIIKNQVDYPATAYYRPYGYFIFYSKNENKYMIADEEKHGINLDFLKVMTDENFKAELIVSSNWKELDSHFYKNRETKLIEKSIKGLSKKDVLVYVQKSSIDNNELLKIFEHNNICAKIIEPMIVHSLKELKGLFLKTNFNKYSGIAIDKNLFIKNKTASYYNQVEIE